MVNGGYKMEALMSPVSRLCKWKCEFEELIEEQSEEIARIGAINEGYEEFLQIADDARVADHSAAKEGLPVKFVNPSYSEENQLDLSQPLLQLKDSAILTRKTGVAPAAVKPGGDLRKLVEEQQKMAAEHAKTLQQYQEQLDEAVAYQRSWLFGS